MLRAHDGTRTRDLRLTKALLYQLSYVSGYNVKKKSGAPRDSRIQLRPLRVLRKNTKSPCRHFSAKRTYTSRPTTQPGTPPTRKRPSESGRRDSNPRPTAWKAVTLPTELLPRLDFDLTNPLSDEACSPRDNFAPSRKRYSSLYTSTATCPRSTKARQAVGGGGFEPSKA